MAFSQRNEVTQFLHSLQNAEASPEGLASEESFDFAMFTNTDFYDIDAGQTTSFNPRQPRPRAQKPASSHASPTSPDEPQSAASTIDEFSQMDFPLAGEFNFPEYGNSYASPTIPGFPDTLQNLQSLQAGHPAVYSGVAHPQQNGYLAQGPRVVEKRKVDAHSPGRTFEEESRRSAEEDKRRRNTAASARFRVKKKQREQALEKSTKEMTEKLTSMENRISQLETENKWLKNIVLEKNGGNHDLLSKLLDDFHAKHQAENIGDEIEVSNLKAPTSPEEREAADSSG